jgi:S1-C subfamily serine protease
MADNAVDPLVLTVAPIQVIQAGAVVATATSFFYANKEKDAYFLVTNRHVVEGAEAQPVKYDALRLKLHIDPSDISKNATVDLPLRRDSGTLWKGFNDPQIDLAVLPLDKAIMGKYLIRAFSAGVLPPPDLQIGVGEEVLVVGYPMGFHDDLHNLPIFRSATVASVYPVPFKGKPFFLADSLLHPGTSGSPVVLKPSTIIHKKGGTSFMSAPTTYFLGVNSGEWTVRGTGLGLNAVWFARLVEELTSQA